MNLPNFLKRGGDTVELSAASVYDVLSTLSDASSAADEVYTPDFAPTGGWDAWCTWASKQGKIARITRSLAKTAMAFDFGCEDEKALKLVRDLSRKTHLKTTLIHAFKDWLVHGRMFIEPVYEISGKDKDLIKIKLVSPASMKVFRDNMQDITELKDYLIGTDDANYATDLKTGSGNNIIGYMQCWEKRHEKEGVFFRPGDLIFIPRYPDHDSLNGTSLLQENYTTIMNKLGLEKSQAIMAKRFVDPILKFILPEKWWKDLAAIRAKVNKGIKAGLNIWLPEGASMETVEPKGNPAAVIRAQNHTENQFVAGMGFADSFTESTSSNRSVGEIQLQFLERDIAPEREMLAEVLEDELIHPYVREKLGKSVGLPVFAFKDLTPKNEIEWAKIMVEYLPHMTDSQKLQLYDDLGYPVADGEELPQAPPAPEPQPNEPTQADNASQKGVQKAVSKTAKGARESFKDEIDRLRTEIAEIL